MVHWTLSVNLNDFVSFLVSSQRIFYGHKRYLLLQEHYLSIVKEISPLSLVSLASPYQLFSQICLWTTFAVSICLKCMTTGCSVTSRVIEYSNTKSKERVALGRYGVPNKSKVCILVLWIMP